MSSYQLKLTGIDFYAFHGCNDEEKKLGHRYVVNLEGHIDGTAHLTDMVSDTVDYAEITSAVIELGSTSQCSLIEFLAKELCDHLLALYPMITRLTIEVCKPLPPMPSIIQSVSVVYSAVR